MFSGEFVWWKYNIQWEPEIPRNQSAGISSWKSVVHFYLCGLFMYQMIFWEVLSTPPPALLNRLCPQFDCIDVLLDLFLQEVSDKVAAVGSK